MRTLNAAFYWLAIAGVVAALGLIYSFIFTDGQDLIVSAIFALFCGMPILIFRRRFHAFHRWLRSRPTFLYHAISLVLTFLLVNIGYTLGATFLHLTGLIEGDWRMLHLLPARIFLYSLAGTGLVLFVLHVRELLGRRVFISLLTGRYRNPVHEARVFLFIDLADSVNYAATHGGIRTLKLFSALYGMMDRHIYRHGGAVDDYIGDAAMITWPLAKGLRDAACVKCVFDILADIGKNEKYWLRQHGRVPQLRAALHAGPVVTGEIGLDHRKITYFGNTVNVAARIEKLAKELAYNVVISADLCERLTLPAGIKSTELGAYSIKGRTQPVTLHALSRV